MQIEEQTTEIKVQSYVWKSALYSFIFKKLECI
jgi:hypothetical protein